jgi:hypothetical protein
MKKTIYGVMKTTEGITIHYIQDPGQNKKPHNLNGPAMIYADGKEEYYINGLKITQSQFVLFTRKRSPKQEEEEA